MRAKEILELAAAFRRHADATNLYPYPELLSRVAEELEDEAVRLEDGDHRAETPAIAGNGADRPIGETTYAAKVEKPHSVLFDRIFVEGMR